MDNDVYYYILASLPLLYYLFTFWKSSRSHGLRLPPGPWQLPVIGSLHHLAIRGSLVHRGLRELSHRYGPLMSLKFGEIPVIVASSSDAAKEFMKTHDAIFSTRPVSLMVKIFHENGMGIVWAPYGDQWRQLRKICNMELLSAKRVQTFRPVREEEAVRLVHAISSATTPVVNLCRLVGVYVADASVHAIMGRRFRDRRDALIHFVDEGVRLAGGFSPTDFFPSSFLVRVLSRAVPKVEHYRKTLYAFMDEIVREHQERRPGDDEDRQEDLIDVLLRIKEEGSHQYTLTMPIIEAVVFDLVAGSMETAATTLKWAMAELMRNPEMMAKAQAEVREVYKGQTKVTEDRLGELSYMHLVLKETLRLHVAGPLLIPKQCQEQCQILGYDVPKGTMVLVNAWAIARNPDYWDDPETFNPERFLVDKRDYKGNDFDFTPFGAGRRICPGMAFGLANIELGLATLLFHFDWSLPEGMSPSEMDMTETMGITARKKEDLMLSPTLRVPLAKVN